MAKFENLPNQITDLATEWDGHSGMEVEDFISRKIEKTEGQDIVDASYDSSTSILTLLKSNGDKVETEVSVIPPTYSYGIMVYGVMLDNKTDKIYTEANSSLLMQYNSDRNVKVGIAMYAVATTSVTTDRIGPFNVKISYGTQSGTFRVNNIKYNQCIIDPSTGAITGVNVSSEELIDTLAWIDITELFTKTQSAKKITAQVIDDPEVEDTLDLPITTEVITLNYNGEVVLSNNLVNFSLTGGTTSNYHLEGFNNGSAFSTSGGVLNYSSLTSGLNQLAVKAVHNTESSIYTDYIYVDIIYTYNCAETIVAINGVSNGIANNGVATLYELTVFSPDNSSMAITTYLENEMPDSESMNPTEIMKYEVISASSYNEQGVYDTSYKKYIEINSSDSEKYLVIKVDDTYYKFYTVFTNSLGQTTAYTSNFKTMRVEAVNPEFIYSQDIAPSKNFDQIEGYLNDIFVTDEYATGSNPATVISDLESSDGWQEEDGRTIFKVSAQDNPILKSPLSLGLGNNFTIELGFKTYNISDESKPIATIGNFQLRPTQFCWNTEDNDLFNARNAQFQEGVETHVLVTVQKGFVISKSDIYYPNFLASFQSAFDQAAPTTSINLVRIYVNGVIDREISLTDSELNTFASAALQINPTTADIDFYLFRVYNSTALTFNQVQKNYLSFLKEKTSKEEFFDKNDILGTNGEISFSRANSKYNTLVYVFPTGAKFPHRAWGGEDNETPPQETAQKNSPVTLFVNYANSSVNNLYGGRLTHGQVKGQGSSAMRYLIWNVTYALNKLKDQEGQKIKSPFTPYSQLDTDTNTFREDASSTKGYYVMPPYDGQQDTTAYKITKLVGKVNFASSMQSHKIGSCKLFDDAYKESRGNLISGGQKAVHEEPFLYFYWETDLEDVSTIELADLLDNDESIKFMGFQTWGAGKGDDASSGYDEDITPEYLMLEGGENTDPSVNFRRPWQALQRASGVLGEDTYGLTNQPTITYANSLLRPWDNLLIEDESVVYDQRGAWDIDYGCEEVENDSGKTYFQFAESVHESLKKFREFYDFVYTHDYNMVQTSATSPSGWDVTKKYIVTASTCTLNPTSHKSGDIYRYDDINGTWVCAGVSYESATGWARANIYELAGTSSALGIPAALDAMKANFITGIKNYIDVNDIAFHQAFIKFVSGTDNRAKNTYFQIIGKLREENEEGEFVESGKGDYLVRLIGDDLDTILVTDNNGLQSKSYNLLETSYREADSVYWGDANNVFFYMFDQCFESEIKTYLASVINTAFKNSNSMEDKSNYFYKVFFNVQETFPAVAYNHTAKIYYENAQAIKNSKVLSYYSNNEIEPIEQSHGSCLACEKQFMTKRFAFLSTYAQTSLGAIALRTASSAGSGDTLRLRMEFEPYQDCYPVYHYNGKNLYLSNFQTSNFDAIKNLAQTGNSYTAEINQGDPAINQGIYLTTLYKKLNILGLKMSTIDADFARTTEFQIDNAQLDDYTSLFPSDYPDLAISLFTPSFPVLESLTLRNMTLPTEMDLSKFLKLETIDFSKTTTKSVVFPQTGRLKNVILPDTIETFRIYDNPGLTDITFEGLNNLSTVYIDCDNVGSFDVANFCEQLINCNALQSVTIRNANLYITEDALRKMILTNTCNLTGDIYIVNTAGSTQLKAISFATKQLLVNTFGDISSSSSKIRIHFQSAEILDFSCAGEVSVYYQAGESGTIVRQNLFDITVDSGNDVEIKSGTNPYNPSVNGYLDITYSMSGVSTDIATIDQTGAITLKKESSSTATVTISMKVANSGTPIRKTVKVSFAWKAPQLGDFAYADGTFTSSFDATKTLVGLVYAKDESDDTSGVVYIIGKEYTDEEKSYYLGYSADGNSGSQEQILQQLYQVQAYLSSVSVSNYETVSGTATPNLINNINVSTYNIQVNTAFAGKSDTELYINHVNSKLLPILYNNSACKPYISRKQVSSGGSTSWEYYIESKSNLNNLCEAIQTVWTNASGTDIMSCLLYPYFYSMQVYEPSVKDGETLNSAYKKGNWYAPSVAEFSRIIYYRGYSVSGSNFNTGDTVRQPISTSVANGGGVLTTPIFSIAYSRANNQFPSVWSNIVGSGDNAGVNNITTSINSSAANNYSYQRTQQYDGGSGGYTYSNEWVTGSYNDPSYWNTVQYNNAWRLTKHQGVPFTKFNYSKNG